MKKRPPEGALALRGAAVPDLMDALRRATPILLVVGVWLICHPFLGIVHDSRLYMAQALHRLYPDVFAQDLFFAFGSQDEFSLFSLLFAPLVHQFGPTAASLVVVIVGQALWVSGAAALILRLAPGRTAGILGLVFVAGLPAAYGGWDTFSYGEGFATPRLLSEGLSLWLLWALTQNRIALAAALALLSCLLHPLVTLAVIGVGLLFLALEDRRWFLAGLVGAGAVSVAAVGGVPPFDRVFQTMDPTWRTLVEERNAYLFPTLWSMGDWAWLVLAVATNVAGGVILSGWRQRLVIAATLGGVLGFLVTLVGGDLAANLLFIQIQPFRAAWLLHFFAYVCAGILFARLWLLGADGRVLIVAMAAAWLATQFLSPIFGLAYYLGAIGLAVSRLRGTIPPLRRPLQHSVLAIAGLVVAFLVVARIVFIVQRANLFPSETSAWAAVGGITAIDISVLAIAAFFVFRFCPYLFRVLLPMVLLVAVVGGAINWDRRGTWVSIMSEGIQPPLFASHLAEDAQVYWQKDVRGSWLLLRRPSYISKAQGASMAFNREMALVVRDRADVVQPLANEPILDLYKGAKTIPPLPDLTRAKLTEACRRDRVLDAMVLSIRVPDAYAAKWDLPFPLYDQRVIINGVDRPPVRTLYLYRCADLR
jgi:hypothetical protein